MTSGYDQKSGVPSSDVAGYPTSPQQPPPPYNPNFSNPAGAGTAPPYGQGQYNTQYGMQYGQSSTTVVNHQPGVAYIVQNPAMAEEYQKYMVWSIIVTFLCCWPIGICAIQQAREAKNAALSGNRAEADRHADSAKRMIIGSIVGGIVCIGIIVAITVVRINAINDCYDNGYYC